MAKKNGSTERKITSDVAVRNAKPSEIQYRLTVGQGLYLLVMPSGQKYWRLDYSIHGRRKTFAIGSYPTVSLKDAKKKRDDAKAMVADGIDPVFDRQTVTRDLHLSIGMATVENAPSAPATILAESGVPDDPFPPEYQLPELEKNRLGR